MYVERKPIKEVAEFFGVSPSGIVDFRNRHRLPARGWSKPPWLGKRRSLETIKKFSLAKIGKYLRNKNPNWKGGKYISKGYKKILVSGRGYVLEHRLIMEQHLKRILLHREIVHHINGDKLDNRIANLVLHNRSTHASHHFPKGSHFGVHSTHKHIEP